MDSLPLSLASSVEVLRRRHDDLSWNNSTISMAVLAHSPVPCQDVLDDYDISLIITQADSVRECKEWRDAFTHAFRIPELWWAHYCKNSNGYFGYESTFDTKGSLDGYNTWFRALVKQTYEKAPKGQKDYIWLKHNLFIRWLAPSKQTIVLIFDPKPAVKERLLRPQLYRSDASTFCDPYWIHVIFLEELLHLQDDAVWGIRNLVRHTEIHRSSSSAPHPDFLRLHEIARHAIHVSETLDLAVTTAEMMSSSHDVFVRSLHHAQGTSPQVHAHLRARLQFCIHMLRSLRHRAASNKERLSNEIQYAFNTVTQYDSRISVEIGRAAQSDSAAMKTIAFLTLTFLPATYICAIFSMSFFNYNPNTGEWKVAKDFWMYWVVAVPITFVTALLWSFWNKVFPKKLIGDEKSHPRGVEVARHKLHEVRGMLEGDEAVTIGGNKV